MSGLAQYSKANSPYVDNITDSVSLTNGSHAISKTITDSQDQDGVSNHQKTKQTEGANEDKGNKTGDGILNKDNGMSLLTKNEERNQETVTQTAFERNDSEHKSVLTSDGTDSGDESEEDDEPPTFKYTRLKGLPSNFFTTHPVSTATFNDNVFVFGTHTGLIHLARPDLTVIRTFKGHNASVLSLFTDGDYFASGSMDGTIIIGSVLDEKDIVKYDFKRPVHAVLLDKNYQKTKAFVYGGMGEEVTLCSRNWLDQRVDTVLDLQNGPIVAINTIDDLIFWMNDKGITFYHITSRQVVSVIAVPTDSFRSDLYWPRVSFPETDRILIAWGNYIWSLRVSIKGPLNDNTGSGSSIKSRYFPTPTLSFRAPQEKKVEVEHIFKADYLISGITSFKDDYWIVLAYNQLEKDEKTGVLVAKNPDIKLLSSLDGTIQYEEEIGLDTQENLGLNDYHLGNYIGNTGTRYYIFSARAGVIAEQVQLSDRLQWYLDRGLYYKAWEMSQHVVLPDKRLGYGIRHLDYLVLVDDWSAATEWIKKFLAVETGFLPTGDTKSTLATGTSSILKEEEKELLAREISSQWKMWSTIFLKTGHVEELTDVIPTDPRWNLPKSIYCDILKFWLYKDGSEKVYELLETWEFDLYDLKEVTSAIEELLERKPNNERLRQQLCKLYETSFEPGKAVVHLEALKDPNIIPFLAANHILLAFISEIPKFAKLRFPNESDIERLPISTIKSQLEDITKILVESRHEISPKIILKLMFENGLDIINYFYLEELSEIDELLVKGFEDDMIKLYSQYDRPKLLPFMTSNKNFNILGAIEICELNAFVDELIYLLGQVGENKKALTLILQELDDPKRAISFAKSQNDQEIWNIVLEHSFSRPLFIKALIEAADEKSSAFYNPITILQKMNADIEIEGLKDSITLVSRDNDMNMLVNQLIFNIISKRSIKMSQALHKEKLRGVQLLTGKQSEPWPKSRPGQEYTVNPEFATKFSNFQSFALEIVPGEETIKAVRLEDGFMNKLYTTLEHKLEHIEALRARMK